MVRNGPNKDFARAPAEAARFDRRDGQIRDLSHWFDVDPTPVFLVQADGAILACNQSGRQFLEAGTAKTLRGGHFAFVNMESQGSFTGALEKITSGAETEIAVVVRCDDGRWRRLEILPSGAASMLGAFVTVRGEPKGMVDIAPIAEAFRLSSAEGNILLCVARGLPPKRIASGLQVSPHTVRAHLRSLYVKMQVRSMQELIREYTRLTV
ncbi:helix-turn-helix transcriptional regulator [Phenylobacterium sp.]|jgi:DNA-binding CsgD family transcriptional regulator|uniref:helix-turn-helix transcriptional regulator n=1 Tax=Phenylobacterium sp. TaxID=1871053 RepID=UPI002E318787|nr:helix-turn-helix transcriptional regulator [Phenylobacterium sp.]HEX4712228.1 helix-turn-helix transcriptional regulator [Phenylobacterium sp.]